jgi:DGQHR domain-containing protein
MGHFRYECLRVVQQHSEGAPTFCIFHAPVSDVLLWSDIRRLEDEPGAPQRRMSPAKVKAIERFLEKDPRNTIPTSVILTLDLPPNSVTAVQGFDSVSIIEFETAEGVQKPGLIIDGQHRLLGMNQFSPELNVNVVAVLGADDAEKAFQFLVINNKASKVSLDHIRALALHYEDEALKTRLTTARLALNPNVGFVGLVNDEDDSPFRGMISWPLTPEAQRVVVPAAIEASIGVIQQTKVREFDSDDVLLEFFYTIWRRIKHAWPQVWNSTSKLLSKVGVICMTQYMTDVLISSYDLELLDISDPESVGKKVDLILSNQVPQFWTIQWTSTSYDTKVGRSMIVSSLVQIARNTRTGVAWHEDIALIDPANLEGLEAGG